MVKTMKTVSVILLLYALHVDASPLNQRLDYLDPILYLENHQSPNGRYKYGYESHSAIAHQEHGSDGIAKGFYSYSDDQGKIHTVEYVAGRDGFKVVSDGTTSAYTPEVDAARKAHMEAYSAAYNKAKEVQRVLKDSNAYLLGALESSVKAQKDIILEGQRRAYNQLEQANKQLQQAANINILPPPIVQHYEKIWPLPPIRYKDLAIEVNGQNRFDPRAQQVVHNTYSAAAFPQFTPGSYYPKLNPLGPAQTNLGISNSVVVTKGTVGSVNPVLLAQKAFETAFNSFKTKYNVG